MDKALKIFHENIKSAKDQSVLYSILMEKVSSNLPIEDLLRFQVIHSVSAFDKLIHDIITIGMVEIFTEKRRPTPKYKSEVITIDFHFSLVHASIPPAEVLFEQQVIKKLGYQSFQEPTKISDGLALIWDEPYKWKRISSLVGDTSDNVKTTMKLISDRRNAIAHEADMDPLTNNRRQLLKEEADDISNFLQGCGNAIVSLVK